MKLRCSSVLATTNSKSYRSVVVCHLVTPPAAIDPTHIISQRAKGDHVSCAKLPTFRFTWLLGVAAGTP
jgi:hypothetical protein